MNLSPQVAVNAPRSNWRCFQFATRAIRERDK